VGTIGFALVIPPGRGSRRDWHWWIAVVILQVSEAAVILGLEVLVA
jgi:hypothetical protein